MQDAGHSCSLAVNLTLTVGCFNPVSLKDVLCSITPNRRYFGNGRLLRWWQWHLMPPR